MTSVKQEGVGPGMWERVPVTLCEHNLGGQTMTEGQKICPIMAHGWLGNEHCKDREPWIKVMFNPDMLPPCHKDKCGFWDDIAGACCFTLAG